MSSVSKRKPENTPIAVNLTQSQLNVVMMAFMIAEDSFRASIDAMKAEGVDNSLRDIYADRIAELHAARAPFIAAVAVTLKEQS